MNEFLVLEDFENEVMNAHQIDEELKVNDIKRLNEILTAIKKWYLLTGDSIKLQLQKYVQDQKKMNISRVKLIEMRQILRFPDRLCIFFTEDSHYF